MKLPRLLLCAPSSGSGKTTVTCGLLQAFINHGQRVSAFKCGPDFIDPMFHSQAIGAPAGNLDPFLMTEQIMCHLLCKNSAQAELAVLEGVMGYYDGLGGNTTQASTYSVACATQTPAVLVVNAKGLSTSAVALTAGFCNYTTPHTISGVIFNQISPMLYPRLKELVETQLPVRVYGYLPLMPALTLQSRQLGLIPAHELPQIQHKLQQLAAQTAQTIDLQGLLQLAATAPELEDNTPFTMPPSKQHIKIAVAQDNAFCFHYRDNFALLRQLGAELIPFSPLQDRTLPPNIHGLMLGGGYADLYADALHENRTMHQNIYSALKSGLPCIAQGSGFSYLHQSMANPQGIHKEMTGFLPGSVHTEKTLQHFGYFTLTAQQNTLLLSKTESMPIHEFHYQRSNHAGNACIAIKPRSGATHACIQALKNTWAGFAHLHFYSAPYTAQRFVSACHQQQEDCI